MTTPAMRQVSDLAMERLRVSTGHLYTSIDIVYLGGIIVRRIFALWGFPAYQGMSREGSQGSGDGGATGLGGGRIGMGGSLNAYLRRASATDIAKER